MAINNEFLRIQIIIIKEKKTLLFFTTLNDFSDCQVSRESFCSVISLMNEGGSF